MQKALLDAHVSISNLFPEECLEVRTQREKGNSTNIKQDPNVQKSPEHDEPSDKESTPAENRNDTHESEYQSYSPAIPPTPEISHDLSEPSSSH